MAKAHQILRNGRVPVPVWTSEIASVSFFTNLAGLEDDFTEALDMIDAAYFSLSDCVGVFNDSMMKDDGRIICEKTIAAIHSHIRAAINPIEEAFWNLNAMCATQIEHQDFLIMDLEKIKARLTGKVKSKDDSEQALRKKRAIAALAILIIAAVTTLSAGIAIALAVESSAKHQEIEYLHNTFEKARSSLGHGAANSLHGRSHNELQPPNSKCSSACRGSQQEIQ